MSKKVMTVAELAAYLRTIPNQNMPVYVKTSVDDDGYNVYGPVDEVYVADDGHLVFYADGFNAWVDDGDFDGGFIDDDDIPALNAAEMHSKVDEMLRRAEAGAAFYGVRG